MTTPFDALDAASCEAAIAVFGGVATITPRARSEHVSRPVDPDRAAMDVNGIFSEGSDLLKSAGSAQGTDFKGATRVSAPRSTFWIAPEQVAAIPYDIRTGDRLTVSGKNYSVTRPASTDRGELLLHLSIED